MLNFITIAVFYLLLNAPFIAMVQITVYAGAMVVLFLFVIMLLGADRLRGAADEVRGPERFHRYAALFLGLVLLGVFAYVLLQGGKRWPRAQQSMPAQALGMALFQSYVFPFQVTGVLLLAARSPASSSSATPRSEVRTMPSAVTVDWYVALSGILFAIGALGVLLRRNAIILFMSVELMLNSANLLFVAFARHLGDLDGQVLVFFVITVAAAEVAVGLALIVAIFRTKKSINIDEINLMNG